MTTTEYSTGNTRRPLKQINLTKSICKLLLNIVKILYVLKQLYE